MIARIQMWGNCPGLRIGKTLLGDSDLSVGDEGNLSVREGILVVAPVGRTRGKPRLEELAV